MTATSTQKLTEQTCDRCGDLPQLEDRQIRELMNQVDGWERKDGAIRKAFEFKNFYETVAFVNAVAWVANREDHHPDLEVSYNKCRIHFTTHGAGGLTQNDFICAAKIDALLRDIGSGGGAG